MDITGQTFGRWTVVSRAGSDRHRQSTWLCRCECGSERIVLRRSLVGGVSRSCGCLHSEVSRDICVARTRHAHCIGGRLTKERRAWANMKSRCYHKKHALYKNYGGRGIRVCNRWRRSFEDFLADVGPAPSASRTLGRVDNDGDYEPGNVRWETWREQGSNKRNNRFLTLDGRTETLSEWSRLTGISITTIRQRLDAYGWDLRRALTTPISNHPR